MWHELVLHGVGGNTIAEAKERLTYDEAMAWFAYIGKRGSLNIGNRLEHGFALLAAIHTGKPMKEFMQHIDKDKADLEEVFAMLGGG